jgi:hypothetical protein
MTVVHREFVGKILLVLLLDHFLGLAIISNTPGITVDTRQR